MIHHVIIGASIAGLSAAEAIRERDAAARLTLISDEQHDFYSRPGLAYTLRGDIPEKQLFARTSADWQALNAARIQARAEAVDPAAHVVRLSNGQSVSYDRLLLATGSVAVPADFPGADLPGVVKLDNLDDARAIAKLAGRGKPAVVIGGGITALELVEGLRARGCKVHYLMRGDRYWANVLDETESRLIEERLRAEGVVIHPHTQIRQALSKRGKLTAVETTTGETLKCDILAVAIGVRPRLELAHTAGLRVERGLLVDEFMRTSTPDVYAAGDVAQVFDPLTGRASMDVLWSAALEQGRAAGLNMSGASTPYVKAVPMNVTQLAGLVTTIIGAVGGGRDEDMVTIARGDSETWRTRLEARVYARRDQTDRVRVLVGERAIVGALIMGDQAPSRPLHRLIAAQADITPVKAALMAGGSTALPQLLEFHQHWESARHATKNV